MNLNKTCPECDCLLPGKMKQCSCGWFEKLKIDHKCCYQMIETHCENIATMAGRHGNLWYCSKHWHLLREQGDL